MKLTFPWHMALLLWFWMFKEWLQSFHEPQKPYPGSWILIISMLILLVWGHKFTIAIVKHQITCISVLMKLKSICDTIIWNLTQTPTRLQFQEGRTGRWCGEIVELEWRKPIINITLHLWQDSNRLCENESGWDGMILPGHEDARNCVDLPNVGKIESEE